MLLVRIMFSCISVVIAGGIRERQYVARIAIKDR